MPRQPRLDAPGLLHHVIARGIERGEVFADDRDRQTFVSRLGELVSGAGARAYAWCLLSNHFHLVLRRGERPLAWLMRRLMTGHAVRYNLRHEMTSLTAPIAEGNAACRESDGGAVLEFPASRCRLFRSTWVASWLPLRWPDRVSPSQSPKRVRWPTTAGGASMPTRSAMNRRPEPYRFCRRRLFLRGRRCL
jgi:REP element-mobilizing transposase RayT